MAKTFEPCVFTANALVEGDAVYLGPAGWVRDVRDAAVARSEEERAALAARAAEGERANLVVGVYDLAVSLEGGRPWPVLRREQIKASRRTSIPVGPERDFSRAA